MSKYYVVWKGKKTGVFSSWPECQRQVTGFPGAKFKAFPSLTDAEKAFIQGWEPYYGNGQKPKSSSKPSLSIKYEEDSLSVDAACSGNPGPMEYKGVSTKTGETLFHFGPITGTNNIGEFLAIVHGLGYLKERKLTIPIYSDSQTAIKWVKMKKANTTLKLNEQTREVWQLINRAEKWLETNTYTNKIYKWETEYWGEIKADFGRK